MRSFVVAIFMPNLIIRWRVFGKKEKTSWDESEIKRKKKQKTLLSDVTSHRDRKCLFYKRRMCIISYYIMLICRVRDCSCSLYDVMKLSVWMKILTLFNFFFLIYWIEWMGFGDDVLKICSNCYWICFYCWEMSIFLLLDEF